MRLKSKVAVAIAIAALVVAVSAVSALAAATQQTVALQVGDEMGSGYRASYGQEITLAPALLSNIELPGDKIHFQVLVKDVDASGTPVPGLVWKDFQDFEDIQLEDTNTVQPFAYRLGMDDKVILTDGSSVLPQLPYQIRCEYKPAGSSTAPASYSETETVSLVKNNSTKVGIKNGAVKHAGTALSFQVSPSCGVGTINVTVKKAHSKTLTYKLTTNEDGYVAKTLKLGNVHGTYKVYAKFAGNMWGVASPTATKSVHANH
jgi:hypothetical protein